MIEEAFVNFKTAKLLKEKGFNESCTHIYNIDKPDYIDSVENIPDWDNFRAALNEQLPDEYISCPTIQKARAWLKKIKGLFIEIRYLMGKYRYVIIEMASGIVYDGYWEDSEEKALDLAIKRILEDLI